MTTSHPTLELELLNLATAASLARTGLLRTMGTGMLRDNPFHAAARLLRYIDSLEDALRQYDRGDLPVMEWTP
jgi:hypothetical protein